MESRSLNDDSPMAGASGSAGQRIRPPAAASLAHRPDFRLGSATVRPSIRIIESPQARVPLEPRVMQVLLALVDARGAVLARADLLRSCWPGMVVGDDAVNRCVAELRRIARESGAGFAVETIPRVGYRLTGDITADLGAPTAMDSPAAAATEAPAAAAAAPPLAAAAPLHAGMSLPAAAPPPAGALPRRRWLLGAVLGAACAGGAGLWAFRGSAVDPLFAGQMERGKQILRMDLPDSGARGIAAFREAVALEPDDAAAWGWLAVAHQAVASWGSPREAGAAVQACEQAAGRALAIDGREPNALASLALLQRKLDDWLTTEKKLRAVLAIDAANWAALDGLVALWQAAGFARESWDLNEQAIAHDALRPTVQQRRALKHWILGRHEEANQVIERAFELWPSHPLVWNARLLIFAFTGRVEAARAMLDDEAAVTRQLTSPGLSTWRLSLRALETREPDAIAAARAACLESAATTVLLSAHAIMILSELDQTDAAYTIVDGLLLQRGPVFPASRAESDVTPAHDPRWRQTQWMYTPATRRLRADSRFAALCEAIGLSEYWRRRGVGPDERQGQV